MSIGDNIKKRRYELRMSQQELADAMGYKTRSTIAKIESGENDVSQRKLLKFAAVLDTTPETLLCGFERQTSEPVVDFPEMGAHKHIAIILAGGKSGRNRQNIPSQFININGKPILVYSMDAYQAHPSVDDIYVVCLKGWENIVKAYAEQFGITKLKGLIRGGHTGIESLKNAIDQIKGRYDPADVVIIQEATRPMVSTEMISSLLQACAEKGSATFCHSMNEYVQFDISGHKAKAVDRNTTIALQSPEAHSLALLNEVFQEVDKRKHSMAESCCTMLLYNLGYDINFIDSSINNIKITREEDIAAFGALVTK